MEYCKECGSTRLSKWYVVCDKPFLKNLITYCEYCGSSKEETVRV